MKTDKEYKRSYAVMIRLAGAVVAVLMFMAVCIRASAKEPLVIVIDPGHSGENLGGEYEQYTEKELNMVVAGAMKEELEKYENVTVYLTHEDDRDMSIKDRAAFALEKQADFLFCLHFNLSVSHQLFGAEVWIPAFGNFYAKGFTFAEIEMNMLTDLGLYSRGIKTKLNDKGDNYYGILRYCSQNGTPSVLIEHCHLDQSHDQPFYQEGDEQLKAFGRLDATAVAKYFKLKSEELGTDYSNYPVSEITVPDQAVLPDSTEPEECEIEVTERNEENRTMQVKIKANDSDSYIQYYSVSTDGGNSYSELFEWPRTKSWKESDPETVFTIPIPDKESQLRVSVYNGFDLWTESNILKVMPAAVKEETVQGSQAGSKIINKTYQDITYDQDAASVSTKENRVFLWAAVLFLLFIMLLLTIFLIRMIIQLRKNRKRQ